MRAIVQDRYGSPEVLRLAEVDKPGIKDDEVLVRVEAASIHAGDYFLMTGMPYLMRLGLGFRRPRKRVPGFDFAGRVDAVGSKVGEFQSGDDVFGDCGGSCAEYAATKPDRIAARPANLTVEQAATVAVSGVTALRAMRDVGKVEPGERVLINGASGGVGTYAVQIAKARGAEVTGVCSGRNLEMVRSIGADHVIDYTREDFTQGEDRYDLILDNVANHAPAEMRRALRPQGKLLPNSGRSEGRWFGAFGRMLQALGVSLVNRQQGRPFFAPVKREPLLALRELIESGKVTPVIGGTYSLAETPQAMAEVGSGHAVGKLVIRI
jgi:NADPH:quinone reductase-like Zn-dependent oxidoreductase